MTAKQHLAPSEEQLLYAAWLEKGMLVGLALLVISFALYLFGIIAPAVPLEQLAHYWSLPVGEYLAAVNRDFIQMENAPVGWDWLQLVNKGDFLNFLPVAVLAGISVLCYLVIVPVLAKKGEKAYAIMSLAEIAILILAVSGLTAISH